MSGVKRITILGSTGSIGTQALDIVRESRGEYRVVGLSCMSNVELLAKQIQEFNPEFAAVGRLEDAQRLAIQFPKVHFFAGHNGIVKLAEETEDEILLNAVVGMAGLEPTYHALMAGKQVALANKETIVAGGALIMKTAAVKGKKILPVDSEHSAIFQCLQGGVQGLSRIILTASGGPFRGRTLEELRGVTVEQALAHPSWNMGRKITIDSATMMNKGFEVIEAKWLFDATPDMIDVVVHPQSIIHSMIEYRDSAVMAQMGVPDMRLPIAYAFSYPKRKAHDLERLDLAKLGTLTFEKPDKHTFLCLDLAYRALERGGTCCAELNGANEICVAAFLDRKIRFTDIQNTLERIVEEYIPKKADSVEAIISADTMARKKAISLLKEL